MRLDTKQKVLVAIYTEYQKDIPNIETEVQCSKLGIEKEEFKIAIIKLENEGLITDTHMIKAGNVKWGVHSIILNNTKMTPYGIDYVESKLGIDKTLSGIEKVQVIAKNSANWGWNEFKDITVKVLSEMGKHGMDKALGD